MGAIQSERFAAIGVHAGKFRTVNSMRVVEKAKRKIPLVIINETRDKNFPLSEIRRAAKAYDDKGHDVELYIIENHGH